MYCSKQVARGYGNNPRSKKTLCYIPTRGKAINTGGLSPPKIPPSTVSFANNFPRFPQLTHSH